MIQDNNTVRREVNHTLVQPHILPLQPGHCDLDNSFGGVILQQVPPRLGQVEVSIFDVCEHQGLWGSEASEPLPGLRLNGHSMVL